ncbi:hypothetical protein [Streptomyces sp. FL07-04A]|uniref:hypothetical protein n=1 Tax=Streptomyces sp. FL07-04A TaxID=3028658 RepID=UPI0029B867CA|nr:hypothetical protein [Streptomyces sp. FL07-04A]MDX3575946.1 hypothetical protein [Streptomyces sp. FL07-04A]
MTPADELRAAAEHLRDRARKTEQGLAAALREGTRDMFGKVQPDPATMHPGVGEPLARLLDEIADQLDGMPFPVTHTTALAVARAVLGTPDQT